MSQSVRHKAEEARIATIARLLERKGITSGTAARVQQIDRACSQIERTGQVLTVKNLVRVLAQMYPADYPAESTIRNRTLAGESYREVINAWRTFRMAAARPSRQRVVDTEEDLSDAALNEIRPDSVRLTVLMMRTSLRNMRRQYQILQTGMMQMSVPAGAKPNSSGEPAPQLVSRDFDLLTAFLSAHECAARGVSWNKSGQLVDQFGNAISRPGLKDALERLAGIARRL